MTSEMDPDSFFDEDISDMEEESKLSNAPSFAHLPDLFIEDDSDECMAEDGGAAVPPAASTPAACSSGSSAAPFNSSSLMRSPVPNSEGGSQPEEASQSPVHRPCNRAPPAKRPHR